MIGSLQNIDVFQRSWPKKTFQIQRSFDATASKHNGWITMMDNILTVPCFRIILPRPVHTVDAFKHSWPATCHIHSHKPWCPPQSELRDSFLRRHEPLSSQRGERIWLPYLHQFEETHHFMPLQNCLRLPLCPFVCMY
jgi:hypothetical protein